MCLFLFSKFSLQKTPEPLSFLTAGCNPSQPFSFWASVCSPLQGAFRPLSLPMLVPIVSTAKCDALIFLFCFCIVFVLLFGIFSFPTKIMPRKKTSFACFLLFLHTFLYITFTSLFSIVCAKTDRFKRVSKKLF